MNATNTQVETRDNKCGICFEKLFSSKQTQGDPTAPFTPTSKKADKEKPALLLPCGHPIHVHCLLGWETSNSEISHCFHHCTKPVDRSVIPVNSDRQDFNTAKRIIKTAQIVVCSTLYLSTLASIWYNAWSASDWLHELVSNGVGNAQGTTIFAYDNQYCTSVATAFFDTIPGALVGLIPVTAVGLTILEEVYLTHNRRIDGGPEPFPFFLSMLSTYALTVIATIAGDERIKQYVNVIGQSNANLSVYYGNLQPALENSIQFIEGAFDFSSLHANLWRATGLACALTIVDRISRNGRNTWLFNPITLQTGISFLTGGGSLPVALSIAHIKLSGFIIGFVGCKIEQYLTNSTETVIGIVKAVRPFFAGVATLVNRRIAFAAAMTFTGLAGLYAQGQFFGE